MRYVPLLVSLSSMLLTGCMSESDDTQDVLEEAFEVTAAPGVEVVHAYRYSKREWFVLHTEGWLIQLRGTGAAALVKSRFPDMQSTPGSQVAFMPADEKLAWWSATMSGDRYELANDARYTIFVDRRNGDYFVSYMAGY
jgi:hypothetical protein